MLIIRKEQMEAFSEAQEESFAVEMVYHLRSDFPDETADMTDAELHQYVEDALDVAKKYDLTNRQDLCRFLNLTMFHGMEFENTDDKHWMHEYLTDEEIPDPGKRLDRLYKECIYRLEVEENNRGISEEFGRGE